MMVAEAIDQGKKARGMGRNGARRVMAYLDPTTDGWVEWMATREPGGMSGYICRLVEADRSRVLDGGGPEVERYRAYLMATGRDDEAAFIEKMVNAEGGEADAE